MVCDTFDGNEKKTLGEVFFKCMKKYENLPAQFFGDTDESDTYFELLQRSVRTAITLRNKNGIKPGDIIGLCTRDHKNSCVPIVAAQLLGAINANFDINITSNDMINLLKRTEPKVMFLQENDLTFIKNCSEKAGIKLKIVVFELNNKYPNFEDYIQPNPHEENFKPSDVRDHKQTAVILFSSGTTGEPKSICLNHYSLIKQFSERGLFYAVKTDTQNIFLTCSYLYWITAFGIFVHCVLTGSARVFSKKYEPEIIWKLIEKYKVNYIFMLPYLAAEFVESRPENVDISSLKSFCMAGSLITKKLMESLKKVLPGVFVNQGYGQTETAGMITMFNWNDPKELELQNKNPNSCGIIWNEIQWKIVDPSTGKPLGRNERGELRLKSDFLLNGYYKGDVSSLYDAEGYFKTGDIVYYDENDCFYIVDRIKEIFRCREAEIKPLELEEILLQHPSVKEAVVIAVPHETDESHPMGVVTLKDKNDKVTCEEIEKFVEKRVDELHRLRAGVRIVDELLKTVTGKYKRRLIQENILKQLNN